MNQVNETLHQECNCQICTFIDILVLLELTYDYFTCMSTRFKIIFLACVYTQNLIKEGFNCLISLPSMIYFFYS